MDIVQDGCSTANVLPCLFDAAVFSAMIAPGPRVMQKQYSKEMIEPFATMVFVILLPISYSPKHRFGSWTSSRTKKMYRYLLPALALSTGQLKSSLRLARSHICGTFPIGWRPTLTTIRHPKSSYGGRKTTVSRRTVGHPATIRHRAKHSFSTISDHAIALGCRHRSTSRCDEWPTSRGLRATDGFGYERPLAYASFPS